MDCVVAHVDDIVGIPIELSHPDGQLELFPEQLNMSLYPLHLLKSQVFSSIKTFLCNYSCVHCVRMNMAHFETSTSCGPMCDWSPEQNIRENQVLVSL